ncbi:MAG: hypothetical protein ACC655_01930 [Rhodothermia bacterium]
MTGTVLRKRRTKIFVILFMLIAVLSAIYGSIVFKRMIDNEELQQRLDEVRERDGR